MCLSSFPPLLKAPTQSQRLQRKPHPYNALAFETSSKTHRKLPVECVIPKSRKLIPRRTNIPKIISGFRCAINKFCVRVLICGENRHHLQYSLLECTRSPLRATAKGNKVRCLPETSRRRRTSKRREQTKIWMMDFQVKIFRDVSVCFCDEPLINSGF